MLPGPGKPAHQVQTPWRNDRRTAMVDRLDCESRGYPKSRRGAQLVVSRNNHAG